MGAVHKLQFRLCAGRYASGPTRMRNQRRPDAEDALIRAQVDIGEGNESRAKRGVGSTKRPPVAKCAAKTGTARGRAQGGFISSAHQ